MKKLLMVLLVLFIGIAFLFPDSAQSKVTPKKAPTAKKALTPKRQAAKPKTETLGFVGKVAMVDANLIHVKGMKATVTFDARNPQLKGYKTIDDVKVGDTVAAKYTRDGIIVTKLKEPARIEATRHGIMVTKAKEPARIEAVVHEKAEKAEGRPSAEVVTQATCVGNGPCKVSVVMLTEARAVSVANYELKIVNKSKGGGSGTIISSPTGIFCSTGSSLGCEDSFTYREKVILSASADSGSTFIGWSPSLECPGTQPCVVTVDRKQTITAVFTGNL